MPELGNARPDLAQPEHAEDFSAQLDCRREGFADLPVVLLDGAIQEREAPAYGQCEKDHMLRDRGSHGIRIVKDENPSSRRSLDIDVVGPRPAASHATQAAA